MKRTKLIHLKDAYAIEHKAKIIEIKKKDNRTSLILNQTIFYSQGGGQPTDKGSVEGKNGTLKVNFVSFNKGQPSHTGILSGNLNKGDTVTLKLNWKNRYKNMQAHTAGHILDEAVKELLPEIIGIEGNHGVGNKFYIKFQGIIDATKKQALQKKIDQIIIRDEKIKSKLVTLNKIKKDKIILPYKLPKHKSLRIITIGDRYPIPDGGTQLKSTGKTWPFKLQNFDYTNGNTIIHYKQFQTAKIELKPKLTSTHSISLTTLKSQLSVLLEQLNTEKITDQTKIKYLGKKGKINSLTKSIPLLPQIDRSPAGKLINTTKEKIENIINSKDSKPTSKQSLFLDVTLPGTKPSLGHLHPISQAIEEISAIFEKIGFTKVRYPEVDWDWYVFESLNMPPDHPARDEWETFFIDTPKHPKLGELVLTTHTSNGQVREMQRVKSPPIRMLNIAKCYRRQQDVTHTAMFHQFEGLVIDKGINIQHLKGTLDYFARKFYGKKAKSRIRPFMFRFTEPSFEVDFSCTHCDGKGCRFCKSGWHEVGGAGMVHPNVLKAGNIDPTKYSGFAFGWGVERVYTLKPGLELDDIRLLYSTNLEFLEQF